MNILKYTNFIFLFILFFTFSFNAYAGTNLLFDNFDRPDSNNLGDGWIENFESTTPYYSLEKDKTYASYYIELRDNSAAFVCEELSNGEIPTRNMIMLQHELDKSITFPFAWSFSYIPDDGERIYHEIGLIDSKMGMHLLEGSINDVGPMLPNNGIMLGIYKSDSYMNNSHLRFYVYSNASSTEYVFDFPNSSFQFEHGNRYDFEVNVNKDGEVDVVVSKGNIKHFAHTVIEDKNILLNKYDSFLINPTQGCAGYGYTSPDVQIFFDNISVISKANTAPAIVLNGDNPLEIEIGDEYVEQGFVATDSEDGDITENVAVDSSELNINEIGEYNIYYTVADSEGAVASTTRKVIVIESSVSFDLLKNEVRKLNSNAKRPLLWKVRLAEYLAKKCHTKRSVKVLRSFEKNVRALSSKRVPKYLRISKSEAKNLINISKKLREKLNRQNCK